MKRAAAHMFLTMQLPLSFSVSPGADSTSVRDRKRWRCRRAGQGRESIVQTEREERGRRASRARQIKAQQDEGRRWKRARHRVRHKDTGPLRYTAKPHLTEPHRNLLTRARRLNLDLQTFSTR